MTSTPTHDHEGGVPGGLDQFEAGRSDHHTGGRRDVGVLRAPGIQQFFERTLDLRSQGMADVRDHGGSQSRVEGELLRVHDVDLGVPPGGLLEGETQDGVHGLPHVGPDHDGTLWSGRLATSPYQYDGPRDGAALEHFVSSTVSWVRASIEFDKWLVEQFGLASPEDKEPGEDGSGPAE